MECNLPMTLLVRLESNGRGKPRNRKDNDEGRIILQHVQNSSSNDEVDGVGARSSDGGDGGGGGNEESQFFSLIVRLVDINDNSPRFPRQMETIFVSEGLKIGSRLPLPLASDPDSLEFGIARCTSLR
ncbi:unnamed protein product [Protopolystoma xenopodis]|uniref:Cadherin domain-containing protein n=1 Tax=Protopolystoma xenopodis TaxID=117903 RepID=A0A3S5AWB1_9PLAT|nr:unnamed protein product [Protopolystoma xenopodis]